MNATVRPIREWAVWNQLFLLLSLLNFLDYWSTSLIIAKYGYDAEANPLMRLVISCADTPLALLAAKVVLIGAVWWWLDGRVRQATEKKQKIVDVSLAAMNGLFFGIVISNFTTYYLL